MIASFKAGLWFVQSCRASPWSMTVSWNQGLWNRWFQRFKDISIQYSNIEKLSHADVYMSIYIYIYTRYIHTYIHRTFIHDIWLNFCHDITFNKVHRFFNGCWNQDGCKHNKTNMKMEDSNHLKMYPLLNKFDFPCCHVRMPWSVEHRVSLHPTEPQGECLACQAMPVLGDLENECWRIRDHDQNPSGWWAIFFLLVIFKMSSDTPKPWSFAVYIGD